MARTQQAESRMRERQIAAVVFDRYSVWVEAVKRLAERAGVSWVVATTSAREAIAALEARRVDLFILGLERNAVPTDVQEALFAAAAAASGGLVTLVVGDDDDPAFVHRCLASGADAYVLKTVDPDDLMAAIRQSVDQTVYLFARPKRNGDQQAAKTELTPRELQVLRLAAEGLPNAEIARRLWIGEATVKYHLSRTYEKLGVSNRTTAARCAARQGLLSGTTS